MLVCNQPFTFIIKYYYIHKHSLYTHSFAKTIRSVSFQFNFLYFYFLLLFFLSCFHSGHFGKEVDWDDLVWEEVVTIGVVRPEITGNGKFVTFCDEGEASATLGGTPWSTARRVLSWNICLRRQTFFFCCFPSGNSGFAPAST